MVCLEKTEKSMVYYFITWTFNYLSWVLGTKSETMKLKTQQSLPIYWALKTFFHMASTFWFLQQWHICALTDLSYNCILERTVFCVFFFCRATYIFCARFKNLVASNVCFHASTHTISSQKHEATPVWDYPSFFNNYSLK